MGKYRVVSFRQDFSDFVEQYPFLIDLLYLEQNDIFETKQVELGCVREGNKLTVTVADKGVGIPDVEEARQPFYTTKPEEERSGMGFAFMEAFMDEIQVESKPGEGTRITMTKYIARDSDQ